MIALERRSFLLKLGASDRPESHLVQDGTALHAVCSADARCFDRLTSTATMASTTAAASKQERARMVLRQAACLFVVRTVVVTSYYQARALSAACQREPVHPVPLAPRDASARGHTPHSRSS